MPEPTVTVTLTEKEAGNLVFLLHMARGMRRDVGNDKGAEEVAVLQAKLRAALKHSQGCGGSPGYPLGAEDGGPCPGCVDCCQGCGGSGKVLKADGALLQPGDPGYVNGAGEIEVSCPGCSDCQPGFLLDEERERLGEIADRLAAPPAGKAPIRPDDLAFLRSLANRPVEGEK